MAKRSLKKRRRYEWLNLELQKPEVAKANVPMVLTLCGGVRGGGKARELGKLDPKCEGCPLIKGGQCTVYPEPATIQSWGMVCAVRPKAEEPVKLIGGKKINPLKASRGKGGLRPYLGRPVTPHTIGKNKGRGHKHYITFAGETRGGKGGK